MMQHLPLFISSTEILFILFIVIMVFGADKIPDIAKGMGKGMRTLKNATNDIKSEIRRSAEKQGLDSSLAKEISDEINNVKDEMDELTDSVRRKL